MISKKLILLALFFALILPFPSSAQELKVTLSPDNKKVDRNVHGGISTIVINSRVKGLEVLNNTDDEMNMISDRLFVYRVDTKRDIERGYELSSRVLLLNSPKSAEYVLEIDEILPNQVLYYTVVLSDQYSNA
ncbi:MAG: hypothetical protein NC335_10275, partial [Bacteroides sp.]|nr:hypothetical protein [Bacteroides sp.]